MNLRFADTIVTSAFRNVVIEVDYLKTRMDFVAM